MMMGRSILATVLAGCAGVAHAQSDVGLAEKFGALEMVRQASLSPDGKKFAYVRVDQLGEALMITDLTTVTPAIRTMSNTTKGQTLQWCSWSSNERLVCKIRSVASDAGTLIGFSRLVTVKADGTGLKIIKTQDNDRSMGYVQDGGSIIDWDVPNKPDHVLMVRKYLSEMSTGTHLANAREGLGVDDVDLESLKMTPVVPAKPQSIGYITDGKGTVRIYGIQASDTGGYDKDERTYFFRKPGESGWSVLTKATSDGDFEPVAVDASSNQAYGFAQNNGLLSVYTIALDGSGSKTLVSSRSDVDIDDLIRIGRDDRVVGVSYATDRRTSEYFDPELKRLAAALGRALKSNPHIDFVDASQDEKQLLLFVTSDTDAGTYYRFDKATKHLEALAPVRPELVGLPMAPMKAITFQAADGTSIPAYLTLPVGSDGKNLPAIVMPHGGPSARDEWGFDWLVQYFASRGFAVLQPNYRGSAGYGADFYQKNGFQSWRTAIGDVNDAGRFLVKQGIAAADKLAIVGWSYGGYAALQSAVLDPSLFKAIVAVAPVTDLEKFRAEFAPYTSYRQVSAFIGKGPHVTEGSPAQNAKRIAAPVLLFHGTLDQNVGVGESRLMESKLKSAGKKVAYVEFKDLDHQLADAAARTKLLSTSDAFLRQALSLPPD